MLIQGQLKKLTIFTAAIFLFIVAALLNVSNMYLMAVVLALIPTTSWLIGRVMMGGITVSRISPEYGTVGETSRVVLNVANISRLPKFLLRIADYLPRFVRYAGTEDTEGGLLLWMASGETATVKYLVEPRMRGIHDIGPVQLYGTDPLGFWQYRRTVGDVERLIVYPEVLPVGSSLFQSGVAQGWRDRDEANSQGAGTDFHGVREYRVGDELRRINWKTTARTGELAVTEFTQGFAADIVLVLDTAAANYADTGIGPSSAFEIAVQLAASIAAAALTAGRALYVVTGTEIDSRLVALKGSADLSVVLEALALINPTENVNIARTLGEANIRMDTAAQLVCIATTAAADLGIREMLTRECNSPTYPDCTAFWLDGAAFRSRQREPAQSTPIAVATNPDPSLGLESLGAYSRIRQVFINPGTDLKWLLGGFDSAHDVQ